MKLSRKQRKLKKRNLRDKRKRNIERKRTELKRVEVKAKEELENTIKSSLTTSSYGCDVVKKEELPSVVNRLVSTMGLNKVIKVPQRKNGMTSSGKVNCCHPNVQLLVDTYGGERLVGYMVDSTPFPHIGLLTELLFHSVWITPEGKLVDVTKKKTKPTELRVIEVEEDVQYFIPVAKGDVVLKDVRAKVNFQKHGYEIGAYPEPLVQTRWNNPTLKDLFVSRKGIADMFGENWKSGGGFSLPSILTGKYLSYK